MQSYINKYLANMKKIRALQDENTDIINRIKVSIRNQEYKFTYSHTILDKIYNGSVQYFERIFKDLNIEEYSNVIITDVTENYNDLYPGKKIKYILKVSIGDKNFFIIRKSEYKNGGYYVLMQDEEKFNQVINTRAKYKFIWGR